MNLTKSTVPCEPESLEGSTMENIVPHMHPGATIGGAQKGFMLHRVTLYPCSGA